MWIAANVAGSNVLALDLSLSSLAFAARMARELEIANIEFVHGDILELDRLEESYDLIVSTGVLHHMRDPYAGLKALARRLRRSGLMKLGLYSARARAAVNSARAEIAALQVAPTADGIRDFRQRVFASPPDSALKALEQWDDFYSLSMCRDLLFHVQEHQFTLPQIGEMLAACGLELVSLADLPDAVWESYRRLYPDDKLAVNLSNWDEYEALHPATFRGMYLFWWRSSSA
jgi:ubiquinone/menaquinone biosynthesis C-methylase UbiE